MVSQNTLFTVILVHHLDDCVRSLHATTGREGETEAGGSEQEHYQPGQNDEHVPKRGTTSVAWTLVFKHCSFKTTDFKPLKHKQQSYMRRLCFCVRGVRIFFSALLALNDYINTLICVRIPVFASIQKKKNAYVTVYWIRTSVIKGKLSNIRPVCH